MEWGAEAEERVVEKVQVVEVGVRGLAQSPAGYHNLYGYWEEWVVGLKWQQEEAKTHRQWWYLRPGLLEKRVG